jgi:hypothetical protein
MASTSTEFVFCSIHGKHRVDTKPARKVGAKAGTQCEGVSAPSAWRSSHGHSDSAMLRGIREYATAQGEDSPFALIAAMSDAEILDLVGWVDGTKGALRKLRKLVGDLTAEDEGGGEPAGPGTEPGTEGGEPAHLTPAAA